MELADSIARLVSRTGAVKWTAIAGIPFVVLGTVLLVEFRRPSTHVGLLVLFQILNGIGDGIWTPVGKLAVMASVSHQQVAVGVALYGLFGSIGSAIGNAVAGAIWNNVLPQKLEEFLPADVKVSTLDSFYVIFIYPGRTSYLMRVSVFPRLLDVFTSDDNY